MERRATGDTGVDQFGKSRQGRSLSRGVSCSDIFLFTVLVHLLNHRTEIVAGRTVGDAETSRTWKGSSILKGLDIPTLKALSLRRKLARRLVSVRGSTRRPSVTTGDSRLMCRAIGLIGCTGVRASGLMRISLSFSDLRGVLTVGGIDDGDRQPQIPMADI